MASHCQTKRFLSAFFLFALLASFFAITVYGAVTLPVGVQLGLPKYDTGISFTTEQTFDSAYREADSNTTYSSFWFLTYATRIYGLCPQTVDITVSSLSYSGIISYSKSEAGTEKLYLTQAPLYVLLDSVVTPSGSGWTKTGNILTVTGATSSVQLLMGASADTTPPTYSTLTHNNTLAGNATLFSGHFNDNTALATATFSTNLTGTWQNDTTYNFPTTPAYHTVAKTLPATVGAVVSWRWYIKDVFNNWLTTPLLSLTTTVQMTPIEPPTTPIEPEPTPTPSPPVIIPTEEGTTLYFRSDTYNFNSTFMGYGLDTTNTMSPITMTDDVTGPVSYGFRVWLIHTRGNLEELTDETPIAILTRTVYGYGYQSEYWAVQRKDIVLGFDKLIVVVYLSDNGGDWIPRATFLSNGLLTRELYSATWNFTFYTTLSGSQSSFSYGSSTYTSRVEGVLMREPLPQERALFFGRSGDFFNMVVFPYTYLVGNIIYSLAFLLVGGVIYLKHKKWEVILVLAVLFLGSQGLGLWLPEPAFRVVFIVLLLVMTVILYRIFR